MTEILKESIKIVMAIAYTAGWMEGFARGTFGIFQTEKEIEEVEAVELYHKRLKSLLERMEIESKKNV